MAYSLGLRERVVEFVEVGQD